MLCRRARADSRSCDPIRSAPGKLALGFTHFCTRSRRWGSFVIGRKTIKKRLRVKLKAIKVELRKSMHNPIATTGAWVKQMLQGHLNYFGTLKLCLMKTAAGPRLASDTSSD
jgi:hypothetical protein